MLSYTNLGTAAAVLAVSFGLASVTYAQGSASVADQVTIVPASPDMRFTRHVIGADGGSAGAAGERLVYSNTLGTFATALGAGSLVADDITTTVPNNCKLRRLEFPVVGKVDPAGIGGPYSVDFALYSNCPGSVPAASRPALVIPNSALHVDFPDDGPRLISFFAPKLPDVAIPTNFWFGVMFSRNNAGVVFGTPPLTGFSCDQFDFPGFPCNSYLGGFPYAPQASFNLEIYADSECANSFTGYKNDKPSGSTLNSGRPYVFADDIQLVNGSCNLIAYEVAVKGVGVYTFDMRLNCEGPAIPGTEQTFTVGSGTDVKIARLTVDPPVPLPQNLWFSAKINNSTGRVVIAGKQACIGQTDDLIEYLPGDQCEIVSPVILGGVYGAFSLTITCAGPAPVGACCDMLFTQCVGGLDDGRLCCPTNADLSPFCYSDPARSDAYPPCTPPGTCEAACREVPQMNCPWPPFTPLQPTWVEGAACSPDPFPFACGVSACCRPDQVCENLTRNECNAVPPIDRPRWWQLGRYCDQNGQYCPFVACLAREGECAASHDPGGCRDAQCCSDVCDADSWCCLVEWDTVCVREAQGLCYYYYTYTPRNDECARATEVVPNTSVVVDNAAATQNPNDPAFTCHRDGSGIQGLHTTWFVFEALEVSARIHTCNTDPPAQDTLVAIYRASDPSTPQTACDSLIEIACSDDAGGCGANTGSDVCVIGLVVGQRYYIQVATHSWEDQGVFELDIESPCPTAAVAAPQSTAIRAQPTGAVPPKSLSQRPLSLPETEGGVRVLEIGSKLDDVGTAPHPRSRKRKPTAPTVEPARLHREVPRDAWMPRPAAPPAGAMPHCGPWVRDRFVSIQVNVDANGCNIMGDAANEPSIAVDPTDPNRIVIGWRQFDTVESDFRQGGYGYSHNGGHTWVFPGVLQPGVFRSDPVLDADAEGNIYYYSLRVNDNGLYVCDMYRSFDGGMTWNPPIYAFGGDKAWMTIDRTNGPGRGNIYAYWSLDYSCCSDGHFTRSTDGGQTFTRPIFIPESPAVGTMAIGAQSELYVVGDGGVFTKSLNAWDSNVTPAFEPAVHVDLGGSLVWGYYAFGTPNPGGGSSSAILGQMWVATGRSPGSTRENVYVLASVTNADSQDPLDVMFSRSTDGGRTWSPAVRVNDDPPGEQAWQWFGTMSVAQSGRIDAVWNDTRNSGIYNLSETFYAYSINGGRTWSKNVAVSPMWDSYVGWPGGNNKIGDYYHMISDDHFANLAYAATFNGEQDAYFLKIPPTIDCNDNGVLDAEDFSQGTSPDCAGNGVPDECEPDFDADGIVDSCDDDFDNDGVLNGADACLFTALGSPIAPNGRPLSDTTGQCNVGLPDYWRFRNCMVNGRLGFPAPAEACHSFFDYDGDGNINLRDFAGFQNAFRSSGR